MPSPRRLTVDPARSGVYHCVSRCVRRAFLCGRDRFSGRNYEHRRGWIRERLRELAGLFAVEMHSYSVLSNHLHVVVRTQPAWVEDWADEEVARRWLWLFPGEGGQRGRPPEPVAVEALCRNREKLALCRRRLRDLSWFMRCLNEPIARRANREDECTGRFWEGRFKCERLDDEGAALACMSYVDLNPVRAGLASSLEKSDFTSAQDRLVASKARRQLAEAPNDPTPAQAELIAKARDESQRDSWLAPIGPPAMPEPIGTDPIFAGGPDGPSSIPAAPSPVGAKPSALLTQLSTDAYLELLDWTGREMRADKRGRISPHLRPVLERLDLDVEAWVDNVKRYDGLFYRLVGKLGRLREAAAAAGLAWFKGHRSARLLYGSAA